MTSETSSSSASSATDGSTAKNPIVTSSFLREDSNLFSPALVKLLSHFNAARNYYLSEEWIHCLDPNRIADQRLKLSSVISAISDHIPEAKRMASEIKSAEKAAYLALKAENDKKTDTLLKNEAHLSVSDELRRAEYYVDRLMFVYNSSSEILNALAAKIKTLQDSAKNII